MDTVKYIVKGVYYLLLTYNNVFTQGHAVSFHAEKPVFMQESTMESNQYVHKNIVTSFFLNGENYKPTEQSTDISAERCPRTVLVTCVVTQVVRAAERGVVLQNNL